MIRKIITIDESKCNGCGLCAEACHEGAIGMINGKAKLLRDDYCDGLGDCLPVCPTNAISFEEREAADYDRSAIQANMTVHNHSHSSHGCPGSAVRSLKVPPERSASSADISETFSELRQWPVQIKLAPVNVPYFDGADLLIAADCTAFAYGNFHKAFMKGKIVLIGCPKLDNTDYSEKLSAIITSNDIKSITVTRMEVPCCGGIEQAASAAIASSGKDIPLKIVTIGIDGNIR